MSAHLSVQLLRPSSCRQSCSSHTSPLCLLAPLQFISHMATQPRLTATLRTRLRILVFVTLTHAQGSTPFTHTCPPASPLAWKAISCSHSAVFCRMWLPCNYHRMLGAAMAQHTDTINIICTQQAAPSFHLLHPNLPPSPDTCCLALCTCIQCCHKFPLRVANSPAGFPHLSVLMDSTLDRDLGDVGANLRACYRQFLSFSLCLCFISRS